MFLMKETLVDLTPSLVSQAQGASGCIGISNWDLKNYTKCDTYTGPIKPQQVGE
jgi:hypothetical protein